MQSSISISYNKKSRQEGGKIIEQLFNGQFYNNANQNMTL